VFLRVHPWLIPFLGCGPSRFFGRVALSAVVL